MYYAAVSNPSREVGLLPPGFLHICFYIYTGYLYHRPVAYLEAT